MKVCSVISGRPDVTPGGVEFSLWKISQQFVNLGCEVHTVFDMGSSPESANDFVQEGIHQHGVGEKSSFPFKGLLTFQSSACRKLVQLNSDYGIDVFAFHGNFSLLPVISARKYLSNPFVYHSYATLLYEARTHMFKISSVKMAQNFARKLGMYSFYTPLEFLTLRYLDEIVVPSLLTVNEFVKYYHYTIKRIGVAPLGQDLFERYQNDPKIQENNPFEGKNIVLFVGNEWYRKGVWYLLLAFKDFINRVPNSVLIMTGQPQEPFISLIKTLNMESSVHLVGNIDEAKLAFYYSICDVFVLPSFHEGFSNTIIEVMAFSKPVITTPIGGYPVVEDGKDGFIVQPGDHKSIAVLLFKLLSDDALYHEMARKRL